MIQRDLLKEAVAFLDRQKHIAVAATGKDNLPHASIYPGHIPAKKSKLGKHFFSEISFL